MLLEGAYVEVRGTGGDIVDRGRVEALTMDAVFFGLLSKGRLLGGCTKGARASKPGF
jgi:hypothetical protein